jgi:uncharacterized protein YdhG (YjbR/CyaY superfamily)
MRELHRVIRTIRTLSGPEAIAAFKDELKDYHTSKGTIRFSFSRPLPYDLIGKIMNYRLSE